MGKTRISTDGIDFRMNGRLTYSDIPGSNPAAHGLLMNARFIQGIFDDKAAPSRFHRFGLAFDPERNTDDLIAALPQWYACGLRAITVGMQGGGPCFTLRNETIDNNPFGEGGASVDLRYLARLDRLLTAADGLGMAVIVSCLYEGQVSRLKDDDAVINAVKLTCNHLRDGGHTNVIVETSNEYNIKTAHPIVCTEEGMLRLMDIARRESGGMPVGCSGTGGHFSRAIVKASDVALIHGNGITRNRLAQLIDQCRQANPDVPIVCNEDSQDITQIPVCMRAHASWGYYNNMTKQEPPARWGVLPGEDAYFARRMAKALGIASDSAAPDAEYRLMGMEAERSGVFETADSPKFDKTLHLDDGNKPAPLRWLRLAALYPEQIDHVVFYADGKQIETVYDTPFLTRMIGNWYHAPVAGLSASSSVWADVALRSGETVRVEASRSCVEP